MWQELLHTKYLRTKSLSQVQAKPTDSPFWRGIIRGKDDFFKHGSFIIGDGHTARFWEDSWLDKTPLSTQYPSLYAIVRHKSVSVAEVLHQTTLNIGFTQVLQGARWERWLHLVERLMGVQLNNEKDKFTWHLTASRIFSVKSYYAEFMNGHTRFLKYYLWKLKVPLKIRIFMWFLYNKVLLTKDNLAKRGWEGCKRCVFWDSNETIDHLFIHCKFVKLLW
jgi:hypothetical protein